jgi:LDH2 family malate/lactate/ureidoglycolate dehydrogenase
VQADAEPQVVMETATTAVLDARNALGQVASHRAMGLAISKARQHYLGMVTVRSSNHYGAAAGYAMMAAKEGMIGISSTNTPPLMAPPGGTEKRIGNNPLAIAAPTGGRFPLVLDMAFSVVAAWNLVMAKERGERIPLTWALDKNGQPTDDPQAGFPGGMLRSVGDHKGAGLALMMDLLCGVLSGGNFGVEPSSLTKEGPMRVAHVMLAINIEGFMPRDHFMARVDELVALIKSCPPAAGIEQVLVPGEPEHRAQLEREEKGIPLPGWLHEQLNSLALELDLPQLEV